MHYNNCRRYEIIRFMLDANPAGVSPKEIAAHLELSLSTVLKWGEDPDSSGSDMPSKYFKAFSKFTDDRRLLEWFLITTFPQKINGADGDIIDNLLSLDILKGEFSLEVRNALLDNHIDRNEAIIMRDRVARIREQCDIITEEINIMERN